jgi:regulator of sirC expression with transglutaminase-like and TPR domain
MELGRRLDLKIEGIGLPGHFVVKHVVDDDHQQLIDVFDRGTLLSRDDAEGIVANSARRAMVDEDLRAQTVVEILSRVVNNLIGIASGNQDIESMNRYSEALVAIDPKSAESRMMRSQIRAMSDRTPGAIEDLDWLIENDPPGLNRAQAQQLRDALFERQQDKPK